MSVLRVNKITNRTDDGPVELTRGLTIAVENPITDVNGNNAIQVSAAGVVTSITSFIGNGAGITGLSGPSKGNSNRNYLLSKLRSCQYNLLKFKLMVFRTWMMVL